MIRLFFVLLISLLMSAHLAYPNHSEFIYKKLNPEYMSMENIEAWLNQFSPPDRDSAQLLVQQLDFYSLNRLIQESKALHQKVLEKLRSEGFVGPSENDAAELNRVDFSKSYPAKSGDLFSYFYRTANKIRTVAFKNMSDLQLDPTDKSNRALVLIDDYHSTGTQMIDFFGKSNYSVLHQYKKVIIASLVMNPAAISKFEFVIHHAKDLTPLGQQIIATIAAKKEETHEKIFKNLANIPAKNLDYIALHVERPLPDGLVSKQQEQLRTFLTKYSPEYVHGHGENQARTVFFYSAPNGVPQIIWNSRLNNRPWKPLLRRTEDVSTYFENEHISAKDQTW